MVTAVTAGPFGLVEETYAIAEFDLSGRTPFLLIGIRVAVDNPDTNWLGRERVLDLIYINIRLLDKG